VTRVRLRDYPSDDELARLYATPHQHTKWEDHKLRVAVTAEVGCWLGPYRSIADLSCGDAAIARRVAYAGSPQLPAASLHLGDYATGYHHAGPIEKTINEIPDVDLFICSETIEHLADPDLILRMIRTKASTLLLSTPIGETPGVGNLEHVWGWDVDDVGGMLDEAGWHQVILNRLEFKLRGYVYNYQIWGCTR
jgi:hypothetical protein